MKIVYMEARDLFKAIERKDNMRQVPVHHCKIRDYAKVFSVHPG